MPGAASHRPGPRSPRGPAAALVLLLTVLLLAGQRAESAAAPGPRRPRRSRRPSTRSGDTGTLAVVLAPQQRRLTGLTVRAIEAHSVRLVARSAHNGQLDRVFPTASLVKLFLAEGVLWRARTGQVTLSPEDLDTLQTMIARSSDAAASVMWDRFDGAALVRDVAARYDLTRTAPPRVAGQWGEAATTAGDLARSSRCCPSSPTRTTPRRSCGG